MEHSRTHGHGHEGHSHGVSADADRRKLAIALGLIVGFMGVEVAVGISASSLALISDAAHMLTDAMAIGLSLVAIRLAQRPAEGALTFGFKRAEILSAQFNGATLLVLGLLIVFAGVRRVISPPGVVGTAVLTVALIGVVVNLAATWTLAKANRQSLNVEGAYRHILADLIAFIVTAIAGAVIITTGFHQADGIASLVVATVMLRAAYQLLKASGRVFLEAAPKASTPRRSGALSPAKRESARCTTCMCGRSPRALRLSQPTCLSAPLTTVMPPAAASKRCCTMSSTSNTPRCRSTTRAARCSS